MINLPYPCVSSVIITMSIYTYIIIYKDQIYIVDTI